MIDYRFNGRLTYIPGGALSVNMSAWPVVSGGNWWEPTTGSYTCVAAYQAKGAASLAASYVNLANPGTNDLTVPGSAPGWNTSDGWAFIAGLDMPLATGIVPTSGWTMLVRFSDAITDSSLDLAGAQQGSTYFGMAPRTAGGAYYSNGHYAQIGTSFISGVMAVAGQDAYKDGADVGNIGTASWAGFTTPILIGRRNGQSNFTCTGKIQAVAIYSTTLDATQVAEITDNMEAL